jgi:hypothetical protein
VKLVGHDRASEIAKQFGTKLGTLKPGTVADTKGADNPWSVAYTGKDRTAAIASWISRHGAESARRMAKSANATLSGKQIT